MAWRQCAPLAPQGRRCAGTSGPETGSSGEPKKNRNALPVWAAKTIAENILKFWEQLHKIDKLTIHLPHTFEQGDMAHKQQSYEPHLAIGFN